jgi:DNA repair protein RadC
MALRALPPAPPRRVTDLRRRLLADLSLRGAHRHGDVELLAVAVGCRLPIAAQVLEQLDLSALARASVRELVHAGLAPGRAAALFAAWELGRRATHSGTLETWRIRSPSDIAERLLPEMAALEREEVRVAVLNTKNAVVALVTVYSGSLAGSAVRVGEVFHDAVRRHGAAVIVVHNHPSGDPSPSPEDLRITADLVAAGRLLDIELLDHLVLGRDRWVSLRAIGSL